MFPMFLPRPTRRAHRKAVMMAAIHLPILPGSLAARSCWVSWPLRQRRHFRAICARCKTAARTKPFASGAVGVLTAVAVPALATLLAIISAVLVLVCIGLLGFPIVIAMLLALLAGGIMGWIAVGTLVGERLFRGDDQSFSKQATLGTMAMTFGLGLLGLAFGFGEAVLAFIVMSVGLGAVALTQFGRKPYPQGAAVPPSAPAEDPIKISSVLETLTIDEDDPSLKP